MARAIWREWSCVPGLRRRRGPRRGPRLGRPRKGGRPDAEGVYHRLLVLAIPPKYLRIDAGGAVRESARENVDPTRISPL